MVLIIQFAEDNATETGYNDIFSPGLMQYYYCSGVQYEYMTTINE